MTAAGFVPPVAELGIGNRGGSASTSGADSEMVEDPNWRRQYIFVAATLPEDGDKAVATSLRRVRAC